MLVRLGLAALSFGIFAFGASAANDSPAATEIAFHVTLKGVYASSALCVGSSTDLGGAHRLTNLGWYYSAAWSPDGNKVAVAGGKSHGGSATHPIRVENADGTGLHAVTAPRLATEDDSSPAWSPDGTRISFIRYVFSGRGTDYSRAGLWVVDLRTDHERQLMSEGVLSEWSPTGDLIAVDGAGKGGDEIALVTPAGKVQRRLSLSFLGDFDSGVTWSPDGKKLALGGGAIVDRTGQVVGRYAPPSTDDAVSMLPSWSPDGTAIVFARAATAYNSRANIRYLLNADLYVAPVVGGAAVPLTRTPSIDESSPEWRPGPGTSSGGTSQPCLITGTPGRDVLRGTRADDLVDAGAGNDVLDGGGGDDLLAGGPGNDVLRGRSGKDVLLGGQGHDRLAARDGARDVVIGGSGHDWARVDPKLDRVSGVEVVRPRVPR